MKQTPIQEDHNPDLLKPVPAIKALASLAGADPEVSAADCLPLQYVIRAIPYLESANHLQHQRHCQQVWVSWFAVFHLVALWCAKKELSVFSHRGTTKQDKIPAD